MASPRDVLTPDALTMLKAIADAGSFAAAARTLEVVPSALTYRVRQLEEALDVLLFDRSTRRARLTAAGVELLHESERVLADLDAIALRVKRVATGWEAQFTVAVDSIIHVPTVMELCEDFFARKPPTHLRLRTETLAGTLEALTSGEADLALGVVVTPASAGGMGGLHREPLGQVRSVFAVAPHHPLASAAEPIPDDVIRRHRAVAVADSTRRGAALTVGLLAGQDVFTVAGMPAKVDAQLRGIGAGFLPLSIAQPYIETGRLVAKRVARPEHQIHSGYAWRASGRSGNGPALAWWLKRLQSPVTRAALLGERRK